MSSFITGKIRTGKKINWNWAAVYAIMTLLVIFTSLPLIYMISGALKPLDEQLLYPPRFFVRRPTLQNFSELLAALNSSVVPFTRYLFNTLFTTVIIVIGQIVISSMGGYALVKLKVPGAKIIFTLVITALMFVSMATAIPTYILISSLGLINTYWALILPKLASTYGFFLVKQFAEQLKDDYLESARIDGANEWKVFWSIAMPMLKPAWVTLAVLGFIANWNEASSFLMYTTTTAMKSLPLALASLTTSISTTARFGSAQAAQFLTIMPTIVVFVFLQSRVMQAMTYSGIKS